MSATDTLSIWVALPVSFLMILGGLLVLVGALGLMRLPNFYQRIHGPAITVTSMAYFTALQSRPVIHEVVISLFILMTAPVVAMLIMRAAVYRDLRAGRSRSKTEFGNAYSYPREEDDTRTD